MRGTRSGQGYSLYAEVDNMLYNSDNHDSYYIEINCGSPGILPNGWLEGSRTTLHAVVTFR